MHRPARCLGTTSPDVSDIGQGEWCPPICSSPTGAIVWMRERFIEPSMHCLGRSVCEAHPTVEALVYTTCATVLRRTPSCNGTGPVRIPHDDCRFCPPTSAMCMSPTRSGTLGGSAMSTPISLAELLERFFTQRLMQQR